MPNLTSYHPSPIHLNRELPKTYCDLIRHETNYIHFLRTRIAHIHSSLSSTNKKHVVQKNHLAQRRYFDHNQRLFSVYRDNLHLCKKILQLWMNNSKQNGGVDCHNENYKQRSKISRFRLRQKHWKDKIEHENQRLVRSLIYHQKNYRPVHDRSTAHAAFEKHLKLLQTISQYPKYSLTNSVHRNQLDYDYLLEHVYYNFSQFHPNIALQTQCQTLPSRPYKSAKQKPFQQIRTPTYIQQTTNDAIYIYNQPLPSIVNQVKASYIQNGQRLKSSSYQQQELFRSGSCRQLLEPWRNTRQEKKTFGSYTAKKSIIDENSPFIDTYNRIRHRKYIQINSHRSNLQKQINDR